MPAAGSLTYRAVLGHVAVLYLLLEIISADVAVLVLGFHLSGAHIAVLVKQIICFTDLHPFVLVGVIFTILSIGCLVHKSVRCLNPGRLRYRILISGWIFCCVSILRRLRILRSLSICRHLLVF